jgi:Na+:H+ antiporter, NhaA family
LAGLGPLCPYFRAGSERDNHVKLAVLIGSLLAATLATVVLRIRNEVYRRIEEPKPPMTTPTACPDIHPSP